MSGVLIKIYFSKNAVKKVQHIFHAAFSSDRRAEEGGRSIASSHYYFHPLANNHRTKNKVSIKDFFTKCDQIRSFLKT